jgi:hypothetical protein
MRRQALERRRTAMAAAAAAAPFWPSWWQWESVSFKWQSSSCNGCRVLVQQW